MPTAPPTAELDAQYRVLTEQAGVLIDDSGVWLWVRGPDAAEYLQGQLTNDVEALGPGKGCYACLLDRKGRIRAEMRVLRTAAQEFALETGPEAAEAVLSHLELYKVGSDAEITRAEGRATVSVRGPATDAVLGSPAPPEHGSEEFEIGGHSGRLIGTPHGADFLCDAEAAESVLAHLCENEAEPVEPAALEILRVEDGVPRFGHEITTSTMPAEAGIVERAVDFEKGCYIGQETVARLHYRGKPNRTLRRLASERPLSEGDEVRLGDKQVGTVGTAVVSPALGPLALAIIRREAEPGSEVAVGPESITARVEEIG